MDESSFENMQARLDGLDLRLTELAEEYRKFVNGLRNLIADKDTVTREELAAYIDGFAGPEGSWPKVD